MKFDRRDTLKVVLQPYVMGLLWLCRNTPKRFKNLREYVRNERTLSQKLQKMQRYGLLDVAPVKIEGKYVNSYRTSKMGTEMVQKLERIIGREGEKRKKRAKAKFK
ncbi:MAG: winged helix-turn-helix transcriptional regulator [Candidatus Micrarchaeota archaeon]|nr:winged helix-turn-helix transcriptional regulator [Candidatus Micrarchaeota archaeon]